MDSRLSWDDLQFFLAVARTGQLSAAARGLQTSHVTVARRIDRLEYALNARLFERNARGYLLTPVGHRLVEAAEKVEQETFRIQEEALEGSSTQRGIVRLSAPEGFSNFFLTHRLSKLASLHPRISIELVTIQQIVALSRKEADVAVVLDPPKAGPYQCDYLVEYELGLFTSQRYADIYGIPNSAEELLAHSVIGYIQDMIFAPGLDYLGDLHPRLKPSFQSSSIFAQLTATRQGLGIGILPFFVARQCPDLLHIVPSLTLKRSYYLICHTDHVQVSRIRAVMAFIRDIVNEEAVYFSQNGS